MDRPGILAAIGATPMVDLSGLLGDDGARLLAKWEGANPTGSMKDRMALAMIEAAEREGLLEPGQPVVEYTGGSTGTSLAMVCAVKGYPLHIVTADFVAQAKLDSMAALGAELEVLETPEGKVHPGIQPAMEARVEEMVDELGAYWTCQMGNPHQLEGYKAMAGEILVQAPGVTDLVMAVGTGGCAMGNARGFQNAGAEVRVTVVEPAESPYLSQGKGGSHSVEGTAVMAEPPLLDEALYQGIEAVPEAEARAMARRLAGEHGVFAGPSSGMNVAAARAVAGQLSPEETVVTVLVDTGFKYLDGDLFAPD